MTGDSDYPPHRDRSPSPEYDRDIPAYKPKPYTQLVKVQRPEVTRKGPAKIMPVSYAKQPSSVRQEPTPRELTEEEKRKIYGKVSS